jgi:hypothetical protein
MPAGMQQQPMGQDEETPMAAPQAQQQGTSEQTRQQPAPQEQASGSQEKGIPTEQNIVPQEQLVLVPANPPLAGAGTLGATPQIFAQQQRADDPKAFKYTCHECSGNLVIPDLPKDSAGLRDCLMSGCSAVIAFSKAPDIPTFTNWLCDPGKGEDEFISVQPKWAMLDAQLRVSMNNCLDRAKGRLGDLHEEVWLMNLKATTSGILLPAVTV